MADHATHNDLLHDVCDGKHFKDNPLYRAHNDAIQVILYYDDVEMCNPLGSKRKIHKLGKK